MTPEAADGGAIAKIRDGDIIRIDADNGRLEILVDAKEFALRVPATADLSRNEEGTGRELFKAFRQSCRPRRSGRINFRGGMR